jgi:UDPglucose--hexose-1-phosphate uridylyltransferase
VCVVGYDFLRNAKAVQVYSIRRAPGKLKYLAASESAMGVFINDTAPEQAAEMRRDVR